MINEYYKSLTSKKSKIREMYMYGLQRKKEVGEENVFDYSLGNPSVDVPLEFNDAIKHIIDTKSSIEAHGYSPKFLISINN